MTCRPGLASPGVCGGVETPHPPPVLINSIDIMTPHLKICIRYFGWRYEIIKVATSLLICESTHLWSIIWLAIHSVGWGKMTLSMQVWAKPQLFCIYLIISLIFQTNQLKIKSTPHTFSYPQLNFPHREPWCRPSIPWGRPFIMEKKWGGGQKSSKIFDRESLRGSSFLQY